MPVYYRLDAGAVVRGQQTCPGRGPEGPDCSLFTGKGVITSIHNGDLFVPTGNIYVVSVH